MSVLSGLKRHNSDPKETTKITPLLSEEGKEFLDGKIGVEEYTKDARRRVEDLATRQVSQRVRFQPSRRLLALPIIFACAAYLVFALLSFAQSNNDTGTAALITASIAGAVAGLIYQLTRKAGSNSGGLHG